MLNKKQRLSRAQFAAVFKNGRRIHSPALTLVYEPAEEFHGSVVVGKKVAKTAVGRNQLRRRLYAALYRMKIESGLIGTYILLTKPAIKDVSRRDIPALVEEIVGRTTNKR